MYAIFTAFRTIPIKVYWFSGFLKKNYVSVDMGV